MWTNTLEPKPWEPAVGAPTDAQVFDVGGHGRHEDGLAGL
jgi:hypothetical protein